MNKKYRILIVIFALLISSCSSQPQISTVEVTKIVEIPVTQLVEVTRQVEVTRKVEVTRVITKIAPAQPTKTPTPDSNDPSVIFSANYLGSLEQNGITVELARVIFMQRDALKPDTNFDDSDYFDGHEFVGEIFWRITNSTDKSIRWSYDDVNIRINERQINLYDYMFYTFGDTPTDNIFPGSTIIGGVWFGIGSIKPEEITSVSLLMGQPYEPDSYDRLSGNFIVIADLSGEHTWVDLPEEFR